MPIEGRSTDTIAGGELDGNLGVQATSDMFEGRKGRRQFKLRRNAVKQNLRSHGRYSRKR